MHRLSSYSLSLSLALLPCGACSWTRSLDDLESHSDALHCESDTDCESAICLDVDNTCRPCPPEMRLVRFADGDAFCVDRTETTQAEYQQFLSTYVGHPDNDISEYCQFNSDYLPANTSDCEGAYQPEAFPQRPVTCVDICDAAAYCMARGKRLCGGRHGSLLTPTRFNDVSHDEWFVACAGIENRLFPYPGDYASTACNVTTAEPVDVGSFPECRSPEGVLDLSGNISEWTNDCAVADVESGIRCLARGGSYLSPRPAVATCAFDIAQTPTVPPLVPPMATQLPSLGIRCCLD